MQNKIYTQPLSQGGMSTKSAFMLAALLTCAPMAAQAGQYVPGIEGVKSAAVPPPGVYYRGYLVHYDADKADGLPPDSSVTVTALANRAIWVTDTEVLGGNLGFEAILPIVSTDLTIGGGAVSDDRTALGDLFLGALIGWHGERWHSVAAAGIWTQTGEDGDPADPGKDYTELMLTLGGTFYLNTEKDLSLSLLSRYEIADDSAVDDQLVLEWGLGNSSGALDLGLVGYSQWQLEGGSAQTHAAGVSLGYFWPGAMLGLDAAVYREFSVEDGFEGNKFRLALTKVF